MSYQSMDKEQLCSEIERLQAQVAQLEKDKFHRGYLSSIIEHLPIPIAILGINSQGEFIYEFANEAVAKLNNKSVEDHIGHSLEDVLGNQEAVAGIKENFHQVVKSAVTSKREIDIPSDGKVKRLIEYHFPVIQEDKTVAVGACLVDITETNEALKQAKQANRAKSEFLSQMSHELRTPMNGIMGFAQILEMQAKRGEFDKKQVSSIGHILKSGQHLLQIIDDILDLSGIESGKLNIDLEDVDLNALLNDVLNIMSPIVHHNDISVVVKDRTQFHHTLYCDQRRLQQVLLNLMSNAVKYNKHAGTILLFTQLLDDHKLRICVEDNGLGIGLEQQNNLFTPFERLGHANGPVAGTGIGLVISKKFVEAMRGTIGFNSEEGKGSCFWVDIPLSTNAYTTVPDTLSPSSDLSNYKTILYVEDNPDDMELMEAIIEKELPDYHLLLAPTAELGIEMAISHRPDVMILDIRLPGMSGLELMETIHKNSDINCNHIFALSAESAPKDIKVALSAGFKAYLTKPINVEKLVTTIKTVS